MEMHIIILKQRYYVQRQMVLYGF